jgi:hypothetical protein
MVEELAAADLGGIFQSLGEEMIFGAGSRIAAGVSVEGDDPGGGELECREEKAAGLDGDVVESAAIDLSIFQAAILAGEKDCSHDLLGGLPVAHGQICDEERGVRRGQDDRQLGEEQACAEFSAGGNLGGAAAGEARFLEGGIGPVHQAECVLAQVEKGFGGGDGWSSAEAYQKLGVGECGGALREQTTAEGFADAGREVAAGWERDEVELSCWLENMGASSAYP